MAADGDARRTAAFPSDRVYVLPGVGPGLDVLEGAASALSMSVGTAGDSGTKRARTTADEDEADELGNKFKFCRLG